MLSVYQHWDPLEVCAVGRTYPPEFYSFIENPKVRSVMERIAIETEEDYQKLIKLLESFNVKVIRNDISDNYEDHMWMERYSPPPMTPRDHSIMIGNTFFSPGTDFGELFWPTLFNEDRPYCPEEMSILQDPKSTLIERERAILSIRTQLKEFSPHLQKDFINELKWHMRSINHDPLTTFPNNKKFDTFKTINEYVKSCGNKIVPDSYTSGATTTRVGKDLYHSLAVEGMTVDHVSDYVFKLYENSDLNDFRSHVVNLSTHNDAVFVPVKPGLIFSLHSAPTFEKSFPDWEVIYLEGQSWEKIPEFQKLKRKNGGKWWVPGEELNDDFTDYVETWLKDWVLYVEETVFDIGMLVIDPKNVVVINYNKQVFDTLERHGITPHIVNFRHRYFWDGGLHCITSDLSRKGTMQDYFPGRKGYPEIPLSVI